MRMWLVIFMLLGTSLAQAQRVNDISKNNTYVSTLTSGGITQLQPGQTSLVGSTVGRVGGLQDLFGGEEAPFNNDGLSWPPLPRFWGQKGDTEYIDARFGIGLPPGVPIATANITSNYKCEVTTVFHYLGTLKRLRPNETNPLNELLPAEFARVFKRDYVTIQEFFNVTCPPGLVCPKRDDLSNAGPPVGPIVGMCQFEIALYHGVSKTGGASFVLSSIVEGGKVKFSRMTVYSRMFNIRPAGQNDEYSASWYLDNECRAVFDANVRPFVEDALAFEAYQFNAYNHPYNTCEPETITPGRTSSQCEEWHQSFWSRRKRENTVGRCEMQSNGESHCALRSREGQKCPLYYSDGQDTFLLSLQAMRNNGRQPSRPMTPYDQGPQTLATQGYQEYPCDTGLSCTMDNLRERTATCKNLNRRGAQ